MNQFLKNGSYSEYAHCTGPALKDFGRSNRMPGRKKGSYGSFQRNATVDAVDEQQENNFDSRKYSKASSYRKSRHTHDRLNRAFEESGTVSGGILKNATDLAPDIYDEIFRLPPKMSSSSRFCELPVLDPCAYYDEEDLFSTTTVIRNSAAGVIYEDIFGGGLASGPTYTDLSDLLEYFGLSNSRSRTSSSSGLQIESPIPVSDSFRGKPDDLGHFRSNDSWKFESTGKYITPLQSRSVNALLQKDVGEEPYISLTREQAGHRNKKEFLKNGERQKEKTDDLHQASKAPTYKNKLFPLSTHADPVSVFQSSCSENFSAGISHGKSYSSHDYTMDWLKSIVGLKDRSESIRAVDSDKERSLSSNQEVHFGDQLIHGSMKTGKLQKVTCDRIQKERLLEEVWLTIDNLKLRTIPSVAPPPSRLPPMPSDIPNAVPLKMPDGHSQGDGHVQWKAHESGVGKNNQEFTASNESDPELNFNASSAHNEAAVDRVNSFKGDKSFEEDATAFVGETNRILTPAISDDLNTSLQVEVEKRLIGTSKHDEKEAQAHVTNVEHKGLKKQQDETVMNATVADHFHGTEQQERKMIAVESVEQMEEELAMNITGANHIHGTKQIESMIISVQNYEQKDVEMNICEVNAVQGTEEVMKKDATWNIEVLSSKDNKEGEMVMNATAYPSWDEKSRTSKFNKEIVASNIQNENRVEFKPEVDTVKKPTKDREVDHNTREESKRNKPSIVEAKERVWQLESAIMEKPIVHGERLSEEDNKRNNSSILEGRGRVTLKGTETEKKTWIRKSDCCKRINEEENKRKGGTILEEREIMVPPDLVVLEKQIGHTEANSIFWETERVTQLDSEIIEKQNSHREGDLSLRLNEEEKMMNQPSTIEARERGTQSKLEMENQIGHRASILSMRLVAGESNRNQFSTLKERERVTQSESETVEKQTKNKEGGNLSMRSSKENKESSLGILEERERVITQSKSKTVEEQIRHREDDGVFEARARVTQPESEIVEKQSRHRDGDTEEESNINQSSVLEARERMIRTQLNLEIMEKQSRHREGIFNLIPNENKRNESSKFKAKEGPAHSESQLIENQTDHREVELSMRLNEKGNERNMSSILEERELITQPESEIIEKQTGHGEGDLNVNPNEENKKNNFSILDARKRVTQRESEMMEEPTVHGESELTVRQTEENKRNKPSVLEKKERITQSESEMMEKQSRCREGELTLRLNEENKRSKPSMLEARERATQLESVTMEKHIRHREGARCMSPSQENKGETSSSVEAGETVTQTEAEKMEKQNRHREGDLIVRLNEDEHKRNEPSILEAKETVAQPELQVIEKQTRHREGNLNMMSMEEENKKKKTRLFEARERMTQPNLNAEGFEAKHKAAKEVKDVDNRNEKVPGDVFLDSLEKKDWGVREIEVDIRRREREYESERQKEREMEREKDRMGLGNSLFDLRERSFGEQKANLEKMAANPREFVGRTPMEMAAAVSRERVLVERADKAGAEKIAVSRNKAEVAAAGRFHADMSERVSDKGIAEKLAAESREQKEKAMGTKGQNRNNLNGTGQPSSSSSFFMPKTSSDIPCGIRRMSDIRSSLSGMDGKTHDLRNVALESHRRTLERVAKALIEKKQRDLEVQRESAEKERIAGSVDLEIKRWSTGKEANLRALLSTLHYVLWRESGWQTISLTDIITSAAVKKAYRKATLCVHPDKVQQKGATIRQKYIAEKVFDLLKEAWNKFNIEEQK